jgi:prefoldin subunit 5
MLNILFLCLPLFVLQPAVSTLQTSRASSPANLSEIRDVVYTPAGNPFTGKITIEPQHFEHVSPPILVVPVNDGMLRITIVSTSSTIALESYIVTYTGESGTSWTEVWRVPSGNHLGLKDVRVSAPIATSKPVDIGSDPNTAKDISLPLPMADIAGLGAQLNSINTSLATIANTTNGLNSTISMLQSLQIVRNEIPRGVINGSNTTFTLANTPTANSVSVALNGSRLKPILDFNVSGNTINIVTSNTPQVGDTLETDYRFSKSTSSTNAIPRTITLPIPISGVAGLSPALNQIAANLTSLSQELTGLQNAISSLGCQKITVGETPSGTLNGSTATFTLSDSTAITSTIAVYNNGVRLASGIDYTAIQAAINFLPAAVPQSGDILSVDYCSQQ